MDKCEEFLNIRSRLEYDFRTNTFADPQTSKVYEWEFVWDCIRKHKIKTILQLGDENNQATISN